MSIDLYVEAQKGLIASVLADNSLMETVASRVSEEDFSEPRFGLIYHAMKECLTKNEPISSLSVSTLLSKFSDRTGSFLDKAGGTDEIYRLGALGDDYIAQASIDTYIQVIVESSMRRQSCDVVASFQAGIQGNTDVSATVEQTINKLTSLVSRTSDQSHISTAQDMADEYLDTLAQRAAAADTGLLGIPTLLPGLDKYTLGWRPGQMITVAARTGVGKSVFAVNCATAAVAAGQSVLMFSLEMSKDELRDRIVSSVSGVPINKLKRGDLSDPDDRARVVEVLDMYRDAKLILNTSTEVSIASIAAEATKVANSPTGLDMIIVDYLQLINHKSSTNGTRETVVAEISRNIKLLAKKFEVPIMVLAQLNRAGSTDPDTPPTKDNIRESNAIAQDSDIVLIIHRESSDDNDVVPVTHIRLDKHRGGESDKTIICYSELECSLFKEVKQKPKMEREIVPDQGVPDYSYNKYDSGGDWDFQ